MIKRTARYVGHSIICGTLGWVALMAMFEGAYWAECYLRRRH